MKEFTITTKTGKCYKLYFTHIGCTSGNDTSSDDFFIADDLLTWGVLYEVHSSDDSLPEGHDDDEIAFGLSMDTIYSIIRNLTVRLLGSTHGEWEFALPNSNQWVTAYNELRFKTESEKRIFEATITQEPLYSTRDSALMQERRFLCYSGANSKFQYVDHEYQSGHCMFHVGIRLVLRKRDKSFDGVGELLSKAGNFLWNNREKIAPVLKDFIKRSKPYS